ncbi:uncharacterized protein Z519_05596 [Cladophialophora bantiana CBS 173.52]|uniref:DUF2470 domain-containing protein n=1 Tax=Cladophialophora bantiana (strain ATCC 10958 / CBS 173.52 / CDC B-1940 / NIH 8579) TaxID=1442370 RepID=A0A0D2HTU5_CLAB1|nr:uncharacterized protein Z519_05596 [Cladophialophora bantiana CBS 173.52]KIW94280.1 hypothetical protein Z519_05596 [Cladophialophora bantiana CBS 173.52]
MSTTTPPAALDMPSATPKPTTRGPLDSSAMKTRILTHMNADHQLSLRLYLQHYSHVPSPGTLSAQMLDITTEHMIISSGFGRHIIQFEPPMKSLMEARERLVTMHELCLKQLDLSDVVVERYVPPDRAWQWMLCGLCVLISTTFPFRESLRLESGSWISKLWSLDGAAPWLARLSYTLAPAVLGVMVTVHCGEAMWFIQRRLRRHWVEWGSATWWCWVLDCLLEGGGCLTRFDRVVKRMEGEKKGGSKH